MFNRILIVGLGNMGRRHMNIARKLFPSAQIGVLTSRLPKDEHDLDTLIIDKLENVKDFSPEIAVICTPAPTHIPIALSLVDLGVHLLIEKPISHQSPDVFELIKKCAERNIILMVGYNLRFLRSLQEFRRFVISGAVGEALSIRSSVGQFLPAWRPSHDYRSSVSAIRNLGGGVLLELSHEIDYLRWIFGEVDWVRATLLNQSSLEIDVEDTAHIIMGFESRSPHGQLVASLDLDFIRRDRTRFCIVIGSEGTLRWDGILGQVSIYQELGRDWKILFSDHDGVEETYIAEWEELSSCLIDNRMPVVTGADGIRVLEIIEAARTSSITGEETKVSKTTWQSEVLN